MAKGLQLVVKDRGVNDARTESEVRDVFLRDAGGTVLSGFGVPLERVRRLLASWPGEVRHEAASAGAANQLVTTEG
jgi:hypothetical protein